LLHDTTKLLVEVRNNFSSFKTEDILKFLEYLRETTGYLNYLITKRFRDENIDEIDFDNMNNHPFEAYLKKGSGEMKTIRKCDDDYVIMKPKKNILEK